GTPVTLPDEVAPEETILVCVRTTLSPEHRSALAGTAVDLELTSSLAYADAEQWTIDATTPSTVQQSVEEDPVAEAVPMTPHGSDGWYLEQRFPQNSGHQGSTTYRVFLAQESSPTDRVAYSEAPNGWDTVVRFRHGSPEIMSFVNSPAGGDGNTWVYV